MSLQKIFNKASKHLLTQMKKSIKDNRCSYRGLDGTKCAIGCFITNKDYSLKMENLTASQLLIHDDFKDLPSIVKLYKIHMSGESNTQMFLNELQLTHDLSDPDKWKDELKKLAERYDLNSDILNKY